MIELFEKQIKENKIVDEEMISRLINKNYYNGEPIEIGDKILFALMEKKDKNSKEISYDLITLKREHFDFFEVDKKMSDSIPYIKLK